MSEVEQRPAVGVLVVHGIGAQERGETLAKLERGLRRVFPELPETLAEGEPVMLAGRPVRFYEVYWADLLMGEEVRGTFDMDELSSLAWFPLFNQINHVYAREPYPLRTVARWTILLPPVGFATLLAYWGAKFLAGILGALWQGGRSIAHRRPSGKTLADRFRSIRAVADGEAKRPTLIDKLLDEYVGDVLNYVNSAGDTFPAKRQVGEDIRRVYREVIDRFYVQLIRAREDGCESVAVVAHSLGTVVMYHAMRGLKLEETTCADKAAIAEAMKHVEHLYTIGSPLEKIRFFWPRLRPERNLAGDRVIAWDNFVSYFDPVAGVLRRYTEWGPVRNKRLLGGGFLSGHVVYERSAVFLEAFTAGLFGEPRRLPRNPAQRWKDVALLLGETLLAPTGLLLLLIVGTAFWVMAALLVPFLVSLPFRLFFGPETWGPILDYGGLFFGAVILIAFLAAPAIRASEAVAGPRGKASAGNEAAAQD